MRVFKIINADVRKNAAKAVMDITGEQKLQVTIEPIKDNKTAEQRGYFHVLCGIMGEETGYTMGQIKELVKIELYGTETVAIMGRQFERLKSSEELDRKGYSALTEQILIMAAEFGIVLPPPRYNG